MLQDADHPLRSFGSEDEPSNERMRIPPFAALRAFEAFGRLGSIRKAAADLSLHHAVVARHIAALESWTGCALVERGARAAKLTFQGRKFQSRVSAAMDALAKATADLMLPPGPQRLRIWANGGFSAKWLGPRMLEYGEIEPGLQIELRPSDRAPDLMRYEADVDLRFFGHGYSPIPAIPGLRHAVMASPPIIVVAAGSVASTMEGCTARDLLTATLLHEEDDAQWRAWFEARRLPVYHRIPGPRLWHAHIALDAAVSGRGLALASAFLVEKELRDGRLVEFRTADEPAVCQALGSYLFCSREDRWESAEVRNLRDWLQEQADRSLRPD